MEEDGRDSYYLQDDLGSPMQLMGEEGEIRETYGFDEFGLKLDDRPEKQIRPYGYTGYQVEAAGGRYFAQARRYDAGAGRFVSEDKIPGIIVGPISLNRYGIVNDYNKKYNMVNNNCTTFAVKALQSIGIDVPTTEHTWTLPDNINNIAGVPKWVLSLLGAYNLKGYSPADAAMDIKEYKANCETD